MSLFNVEKIQKQLTWLTEQIKCLKSQACVCEFEETSVEFNSETGLLSITFVDGSEKSVQIAVATPTVNQNNKVFRKYLGIYNGDEGNSFDDLFLNNSLKVEEDENWLLYVIEKVDGQVPDLESPENSVLDPTKFLLKKYMFGPGKGEYNPIPNQLDSDIYLVEVSNPTLEEMLLLLQGANTQTFELGDISAEIETYGSFWEYINDSGPYDMTDPNFEYFFLFTVGDITYLYLFVGDNDIYGVGEQQSTQSDYLLVTSSEVSSVAVPSWQQTIDVNRNADRATLYYVAYNGGLFGGYAGASPTNIVQDPNTGRIYYYGYFTTYQGVTRNHIIATLPDGTIDDTFNVGIGFNSFPFQGTRILIQPDGKLVFTGSFTNYNGTPANRIIRLNTDGSVDNTFVYGTGFNNFTLNAVLDNNNKIYITGIFATYNGVSGINRIVRLNPDGTRDLTFNQGTAFNNTVTDLKVDSSNNIYVVGYFASWKGVTGNNRIIKILENGDKDTSFDTGTGFNSGNNQPLQIYLTSDNKVFVIGYFTLYNGTTINKMVKLNLDGTIDTSFQSQGTGFNGTNVNQFFEYQGGYLLSGDFTSYNGVNSNGTILLDTSGNIIRTFPEFTQIRNVLNDGSLIGFNWNGSAYNVGIVEDNYIINIKRFNYSETNGKATYEVGGLLSIDPQEIMPKRLIEELIDFKIGNIPPPSPVSWGDIIGTLSDQTDLQNALDGKEPTITAGTTSQYYRGDKTFQTLDKTAVGLGNVDNTSDVNKPISTATQAALNNRPLVLISDTNKTSFTGTTGNQVHKTYLIPVNTLVDFNALFIEVVGNKQNNTGTGRLGLWISATSNFADAVEIARTNAATVQTIGLRKIYELYGTTLEGARGDTALSSNDPQNTNQPKQTHTYNRVANLWLFVVTSANSTTEAYGIDLVTITALRQKTTI